MNNNENSENNGIVISEGVLVVPDKDKLTKNQRQAKAIALLLVGYKQEEVAEALGISQPTVSRIYKEIPPDLFDTAELDKNSKELSDLVLAVLYANLTSLKRIIETTTGNESWLIAQDAGDIAKLINTVTDKTMKILESIERAHQFNDIRSRYE